MFSGKKSVVDGNRLLLAGLRFRLGLVEIMNPDQQICNAA